MSADGKPRCPDCGAVLPTFKITDSTVPVEAVVICPNCPAADAKWAEHYDGDILRLPKVEL